MTPFDTALCFAIKAHNGQYRKYSHDPYIVHPIEVASILRGEGFEGAVLMAALLHDTMEDCGVMDFEIDALFGHEVADMVVMMTDAPAVPGGPNRAARKAETIRRFGFATDTMKALKLADLISNTQDIVQNDPDFARVYIREKLALLPALKPSPKAPNGAHRLHNRATQIAVKAAKMMGIEVPKEVWP